MSDYLKNCPQEHHFKVRTSSNLLIDLLDPQPSQICFRDIQVGLANAPRFAGQHVTPISVAQHSVFVYELVKKCSNDRLEHKKALLHDSAEMILGDCPSGLKYIPEVKLAYKKVEMALSDTIALHFDLPNINKTPLIEDADYVAFREEAFFLFGDNFIDNTDYVVQGLVTEAWSRSDARDRFFYAGYELGLL